MKGNSILRIVVGVYLIYLGYQLVRDVLAGEPGAKIGFALAGGAFILLGLFLVVLTLKQGADQSKLDKEAEEQDEATETENPVIEEAATEEAPAVEEAADETEEVEEKEE
ncbi:TRAP-type C4-dicarboxylate transport system permease small subunit [Aequitasia blattaphilus]|uniref:Uncharacterized protein n=1 Tax=Aequitasia blattaphilus TaxID=2949332 RepID=A0ABT1E9P3_9FIRM|nr:hypothetical protein [Aequitasia blattaphilus]MCP1101227.1 hypothetical protein [Aequitasia blattaphilus]MCR8613867.1 hypothetical protein [Aequitasia blattaphilus]